MNCTLCGKEKDIEDAIEEGWLPYFFVEEDQFDIACPTCSKKYLQIGYDGEVELKPEFVQTFQKNPYFLWYPYDKKQDSASSFVQEDYSI